MSEKNKDRCGRCHKIVGERIANSESKLYCPLCGYIEGDAVVPSAWTCEECGEVTLHHGGDKRPKCDECGSVMSCLTAKPSNINGVGLDVADLDLGYELLIEAQEADLTLGSELLKDAQNE